jgi:hypothetical protein
VTIASAASDAFSAIVANDSALAVDLLVDIEKSLIVLKIVLSSEL